MNSDVSDEELDNARHEVEFCYRQLPELEPWARQISEKRVGAEDTVNKLLNKMESDQWNEQFRALMLKTMGAQAKYIKLLERRIGK